MFSYNNKISIRQLQALLILDIFGTGVIVLPRRVTQYANQDGWILVLLATILALILIYIMTSLATMFPNKDFLEFTSIIISKPVAIIISLGFIIKLILGTCLELRFFSEVVKQTMLYNTPFGVVCLIILLVSGYAAAKGYETRGRLAEILIFVVFVPLIIVFVIAAAGVDFTNIMPILKTPPESLLKGTFFTLASFNGIELVMLAIPYTNNKKKIKKNIIYSILFTGIFMTAMTIITICRFGYAETKLQMWPIISMTDTINIPGSFLERQEALIMSFWIISVFAIVNAGLFFSSLLAKSIIKKGKHSYYIIIFIILCFLMLFVPSDINQVYDFINLMFVTFGVTYMIVIPIVLLIIAKLRRLGVKYEEN